MKTQKHIFLNNLFKQKSYFTNQLFFLFVNGLFILKYVSRINVNPILILIAYIFTMLLLFFITNKHFVKLNEKTGKKIYWIIVSFIIFGILILHKIVDPITIQVDRWSAIHNFIYTLFQGEYPYLAKTHLGGYGSPFPFWQFLHIPFYILGDVGLGMLFMIILLSVSLKLILRNYNNALLYLLMLIASPAFWYEVLVRSDLLYNFMLCFLVIVFINRKNITINKNSYLLGVLCGLILSTRLSVIIPFAIYLLPDFWHSGIKKQVKFLLTGFFSFILTFLPLLIWDFDSLIFFKFNPFILQSRQGSILEIIVLIIMIIFFGFRWKSNFTKQFSYTSIVIVFFVVITFMHRMISDNFSNGLFSSRYDLTYFNMALPFIIYSISVHYKDTTTLTPSLSDS